MRAAPALADSAGDRKGVLIDITRCDGCPDVAVPRCVAACQSENGSRYPEPRDEDVEDYWPQTKHEHALTPSRNPAYHPSMVATGPKATATNAWLFLSPF